MQCTYYIYKWVYLSKRNLNSSACLYKYCKNKAGKYYKLKMTDVFSDF